MPNEREIARLKEEFISAVSHELRTPLTSIRGALGLLGRCALDPRAERLLDIAQANTERLMQLVEGVLDFEKTERRERRGSTLRVPLPAVEGRKRVLIVDDNEDIREIAAASLEETRGWEVVFATRGSEAIREAAALHPDAILLDVMMPDMDGPTAFRILRSNPETARIPVIFLTATTRSTDRLGAEGVIAKPFDPFTLADRIAETLGW